MRKAYIARWIFTMSAIAAAGVWVACGGSDGQDVVQMDAGTDTGEGGDRDSGQVDSGTPDSGPEDSGADVKIYDAGKPILLDGGIEGGIPCVEGGELEDEPNDEKQLANELKPTLCGVIKAHAPDAGESDFLTFTLGDASTSFFLQYAGNVKVTVETDGSVPVDITQGSPTLDFKKGQPYFVEVTSKDNKQQVWRVTVFEE